MKVFIWSLSALWLMETSETIMELVLHSPDLFHFFHIGFLNGRLDQRRWPKWLSWLCPGMFHQLFQVTNKRKPYPDWSITLTNRNKLIIWKLFHKLFSIVGGTLLYNCLQYGFWTVLLSLQCTILSTGSIRYSLLFLFCSVIINKIAAYVHLG